MSSVFFSVIIPTCHRNDLLSLCLDSLAPAVQSLAKEYYEVIVTDDGSKSTAEDLIKEKYPWARWVQGPRKGPAANRNNGARFANGEWLVFTDDDCLPATEWLETYSKAIVDNPQTLAFEGAVEPDDYKLLEDDMSECPINISGGCFWTANVCVNRDYFFRHDGFDEMYKIAAQEDQDLYIRLRKETDISFIRNSIVYHPVRKIDVRKKLSMINANSESWLYFMRKNQKLFGWRNVFSLLKIGILSHLGIISNSLRRGHIKKVFISICWIFYGIPYIYFLFISRKNVF